ncbi:DUF5983 family protein [Endobacter medicaginis]
MGTVRRFLDLSTAHLCPATRALLEQRPDLVSMSGRFGWLMHVPEDADGCEDLAACAELRPVYALARSKGCDFVLFDADAVADDRLELFDDDP